MEPDRDVRAQPPDQRHRDPRLALGERPRAGCVDAAEPFPAPREVAVQVDAVRVAARVRGKPVRVERRDDPEIEAARVEPLERAGDRDASGLVPVDRADDEHGRAVRIADLDRADRPALHRAAEQLRPRGDRCRGDRGGEDESREGEEPHAGIFADRAPAYFAACTSTCSRSRALGAPDPHSGAGYRRRDEERAPRRPPLGDARGGRRLARADDWTLAAALGIAALLKASAVAFLVLKLAGAVYLAWIGIQMLRARNVLDGLEGARPPAPRRRCGRGC